MKKVKSTWNAPQKALELFEENCKTFPPMRENTTLLERLEHSERIDALVDSVFTGFMLNRLYTGEGFGEWLYDFVPVYKSSRVSSLERALENLTEGGGVISYSHTSYSCIDERVRTLRHLWCIPTCGRK